MRVLTGITLFSAALTLRGETQPSQLWAEMQARREREAGRRLEFEVTRTDQWASGTYTLKQRVTLDVSRRTWREESGGRIAIFNRKELITTEEGSDEFVRARISAKSADPLPPMYRGPELDLAKVVERERRPCGLIPVEHTCVLVEVPIKAWIRGSAKSARRMFGGSAQFLFDTETGLALAIRTVEGVQQGSGTHRAISSYALRDMGTLDGELAFDPAGKREVKNLSPWRAARIRRVLTGKPAPDLSVVDMEGRTVSLAALRGKTVLLDFWASWCPPCCDDAPDLQKLHRKYGDRELAIVGLSVGEDRATVERFLGTSSHGYPIVLTAANILPRHYQIEALPTYIVIDRNGIVSAATEGDQGFAELRRLLKKAGLDVD